MSSHLVGQLWKMWIDSMNDCLKKRGLTVGHTRRMMYNRNEWQEFIYLRHKLIWDVTVVGCHSYVKPLEVTDKRGHKGEVRYWKRWLRQKRTQRGSEALKEVTETKEDREENDAIAVVAGSNTGGGDWVEAVIEWVRKINVRKIDWLIDLLGSITRIAVHAVQYHRGARDLITGDVERATICSKRWNWRESKRGGGEIKRWSGINIWSLCKERIEEYWEE